MEKCKSLTTGFGAPVYDTSNSVTLGNNGPMMFDDVNFIEKMAHFDRERIPERVVHAKGSGAFGYFSPYQSMGEYTCADFLQNPAKRTPILIRFSTVIGFRGSADTVRDPRGFAVRFYTNEGNYDVVGLSFPVFFIRDAMSFPDFIHSQKPSPKTNIQDFERIWDFYSLMPECAHMLTWLYSDRGIVKDYSRMDGFGVNTFVWRNKEGKRRFVKYHFLCQKEKEVVDRFEAARLAGEDPDIAGRTLWTSIQKGYPLKYEFCVQMMDPKEAQHLEFDPLDDTKTWPEDQFPLMKVGMLVLNQNPENYFSQIEQSAFAPANLVPGIEFSADKMLQGRTFAYRDTQRYRVGANYAQLPVNRPVIPAHNNMSDGPMNFKIPEGDINYKPNSLAGNCPMESRRPDFSGPCYSGCVVQAPIHKTDDFSQASLRYASLPEAEQERMAEAMAHDLSDASPGIQKRSLELLNKISPQLCQSVDRFLQEKDQEKCKKAEMASQERPGNIGRCKNPADSLGMGAGSNPTQPQSSRPMGRPRCSKCSMTRERYRREHLF